MQSVLPTFLLVLVVLLGAAGIPFLVIGLRGRNRGVRSCPQCWHLLDSASGLRCPECGYEAPSDRTLLRANRRLTSILLGVLFLVAALFLAQRVTNPRTFWQWMPDRIIVMLAPTESQPRLEGPRRELYERIRDNRLSRSAAGALMQDAIDGSRSAPPGTPEWAENYEEILHTLLKSTAAVDPLRDRIRELAPVVSLDAPPSWPPNQPVIALLTLDRFSTGYDTVEVTIHDIPDGPQIFKHEAMNRSRFPLTLTLPPPGSDGLDQMIRCTIAIKDSGVAPFERSFNVLVEPDPTLEKELLPRDSTEMTKILKLGVFQHQLRFTENGEPPWSLRFNARSGRGSDFTGVLVGVQVDLLRNNQLARRSLIWWHGSEPQPAWETISEDHETLMKADDDEGNWVLRITSQRDVALRALINSPHTAEAYWSGSFERPIEIVRRQMRIAPREWERMDRTSADDTGAGTGTR